MVHLHDLMRQERCDGQDGKDAKDGETRTAPEVFGVVAPPSVLPVLSCEDPGVKPTTTVQAQIVPTRCSKVSRTT